MTTETAGSAPDRVIADSMAVSPLTKRLSAESRALLRRGGCHGRLDGAARPAEAAPPLSLELDDLLRLLEVARPRPQQLAQHAPAVPEGAQVRLARAARRLEAGDLSDPQPRLDCVHHDLRLDLEAVRVEPQPRDGRAPQPHEAVAELG